MPTTHQGDGMAPTTKDAQNAAEQVTVAAVGNVLPATTAGRKQPPPEKLSDVRRRSYVTLSFWLIVVLLGLPIWWHTTSIHRAQLPLDEMLAWADGKACRPVFPLRIAVQAPSLQEQEAQLLIRLTQHALDDLNDFSGHHLRLQLAPTANETSRIEEDVALTIRLRPGSLTSASLHPYTPTLDISYPAGSIPMASSSSSALGTFIAEQLRSTFAEEQAIISYLLSTASTQVEQRSQSLSPEVAEALAKRTTRSMKYAPTYHLTFSLFTSGSIPSSWDIEAAIDEYIRPVLDVLSPIHNFTVDTQVQLYASPSVHSDVLSKEDLSSFINTAEWPLSPSMGGAPTINFLVFVGNQTVNLATPDTDKVDAPTDASSAPTAQSWLIPQWGAVYLVPLAHDATHVPLDHLRKPLLTFTSHLLSLLGAPSAGPLPLRLSTLSRIRSADLLLRASSTLGSLARLSLALPSISIPRSVLEGASGALRHLRLACEGLGGAAGLAHARVAEAAAERAFFEKTMVSQLYFPDEHKIAVYMPLLGPVGVPLLMGALNEARALLAWWRVRKVKTL